MTTEAKSRFILYGHLRENSYCFYLLLLLILFLPFSEEPLFQQWPDISTADFAWLPIATSSTVAMDTQTICTYVEQEREEANRLSIERKRKKQRQATERKIEVENGVAE